jgi:hypothetical protein
MTPDDEAAAEAEVEAERRGRAAQRRRLAEIFGDVLPESTRDDVEQASDELGDDRGSAARDAALIRDVPPHHGS